MDRLLRYAYWGVSTLTVASLWPLLLRTKLSLWITLSLWFLTLIVVSEDYLEAERRYKDYPPSRLPLTVVNLLYIAALLSLSIESYLIVKEELDLGVYSLTFCFISILDIVFCLLYLQDVRADDFNLRRRFVVSFIMGRNFPGLLLDAFITVLLLGKILSGFFYPLILMYGTIGVEISVAFFFSWLVRKYLIVPTAS